MGVLDDARRERFRRPKVMSEAERAWRAGFRNARCGLDHKWPGVAYSYNAGIDYRWFLDEYGHSVLPPNAAACRARFEDLPRYNRVRGMQTDRRLVEAMIAEALRSI